MVVAERDFKIPYGVCEIKENGNLKNLQKNLILTYLLTQVCT